MDKQLVFLCILTFIIHLVGTLAYAAGMAGVTTKRIALAAALFNVLVLVSRTANGLLSPFLAKRIETQLHGGTDILHDFRWLLVCASLATLCGAFLLPTVQRLLVRGIAHFQVHRSVIKLLWQACSRAGLAHCRDDFRMPVRPKLREVYQTPGLTTTMVIANIGTTALWTVGVFAALYAGCLQPELRVTASSLSAVINSGATIMMVILIDPHLSGLQDDALEGQIAHMAYRNTVLMLLVTRIIGTVLAQWLLVPAATVIGWACRLL